MRTVLLSSCLAAFGLVFGVVGCSAAPAEDAEGGGAAITPQNAETMFEQAQICDSLVRDKVGVRDADLKSGVVRWKCGDVDGVRFDRATESSSDFGQEYCEYHATVDGKIVDLTAKPPQGEVQCVFTSAFADSSVNTSNLRSILKEQIKSSGTPEESNVRMQGRFNSRGAAVALINDCAAAGKDDSLVGAERQVACLNAWKTADDGNKRKLEAACKDKDLADESSWNAVKALGARELKDSPDFEVNEDIATCTQGHILGQSGAIVPWRNSDPTICARVMRASAECGDDFAALPNALQGFAMTSWIDDNDPNTPPQAPVGCKYAEVDGKPFQQLLVCTPAAGEVTKAKQAGKIMQQLCNEQFGSLVSMAAPVGAVVQKGNKPETAFCKEFHQGVAALQGGQ